MLESLILHQHSPNSSQMATMKLQPDELTMKDWIFPLNNPKRDYQYNIVKLSLFDNCLVAIPTGLGKTFIAGCVMLNCTYIADLRHIKSLIHPEVYRWFPDGKIVFVAPTKPLVAQQIEACHQSCGIPGTDAIELTGQIPRDVRSAYVSALIYVLFSTHGMLSGKLSACFI